VLGLLFVSLLMLAPLYLMFWLNGRTNRLLKANEQAIKDYMAENNFKATRTINKFSKLWGMSYCHLYVDDNKKKWLLTSPYYPQIGKIRDFSELEDYAFFDEEGFDLAGTWARACVGTALVIGSAGIGLAAAQTGALIGSVKLSITAGITAGVFAHKFAKIPMQFVGAGGASKAFGIILETKDCTEEHPALVFDYCTIQRDGFKLSGKDGSQFVAEILGANRKITGVRRSDGNFKHNVALIQEMFAIFDEIIRSNRSSDLA